MDSATGSTPNTSSSPSAESTHQFQRPYPPRSRDSLQFNNRSMRSNPYHQDLMSTLNRVQNRKRQRDEAEYNRRDVGSQTVFGEPQDNTQDLQFPDQGISLTKRRRREQNHVPNERVITESIGTNTETLEVPTFSPFGPSHLQPPLSNTARFHFSRDLLESLYQRTQQALEMEARAAARVAPVAPLVPPSIRSVPRGAPLPSEIMAADEPRLAARLARRARSRRTHTDAPRLNTDLAQQTITGMVPISEHNCHLHCQMHNHLHSMSSGQHSVSPAIAPASMATIRGNIAPPTYTYPQYLSSIGAVAVPVPVMLMPVPAPPPIQPNIYALRASMGQMDPMTSIFQSMIRTGDITFPPMDRNGIDRHHMFAGLDIDVPVGASRVEIDHYTTAETYEKPEKDDEEGTCTVCLSGYEQGERIRKLPCDHFFHPECIEKWLDINKRCPMCREEIDRKTTVPDQ